MGAETYCDPDPFTASVEGFEMTVYPAGKDRLEALIDLIDGARETLKLAFYIFARDDCGTRVRDALTRAARRGVDTTLIVDGYGAEAGEDFFADLTAAGGRYRCFSARRGMRYLIRNHQKMALADEGRGIVGGFNIADDYFAPPANNGWNDLAIRIDGDGIAPLHDWFAKLMEWSDSDGVEWRQVRRAVKEWDREIGAGRWLVGGPTRGLSSWASCVGRDLQKGRRLDLMMAYFSPPKRLLRRIGQIAQKGEANLVMAGKSDNGATIGASRSLYDYLLHKRAEIWEFDACKMHTKLLVLDDTVYFGSANFDMRSLYINLEVMLRIEDAAFADKMRAFIADHREGATKVDREWLKRRNTLWTRIRWNMSWFLVAVLDYTVSRRLNLGL